jgi:hypothetical protein
MTTAACRCDCNGCVCATAHQRRRKLTVTSYATLVLGTDRRKPACTWRQSGICRAGACLPQFLQTRNFASASPLPLPPRRPSPSPVIGPPSSDATARCAIPARWTTND